MKQIQVAIACLFLGACIQQEPKHRPPDSLSDCMFRFVPKAQTDKGAEIISSYCQYKFNTDSQ